MTNAARAPAAGLRPAYGPALAVALMFGVLLLVEVFVAPPAAFGGRDNAGAWSPPRSRAELLVAKMDGHTTAEIAQDPTMAHAVAAYHGDRATAAYRSSRPLMGWLGFVASAGGRRDLVAPALIVLTALLAGALVLAVDFLGRSLGVRVGGLVLLPALPLFVAAGVYPGICDPLACALTLVGLGFWARHRIWPTVALLTLAGLTRETMLLVPLALGLERLVRDRDPVATVRSVWPLALAPLAYGAWVEVVAARVGALPTGAAPMQGVFEGLRISLPHWRLAEYLTAAVLVASAVVILRWGVSWMRAILAVHLVFFAFANYQVWMMWLFFGRVCGLLPLLALVSLALRAQDRRTEVRPVTADAVSASVPLPVP